MAFQQDSIFWVEVEKIVPNPYQPRREFDEDKLKELAESVRMYGILQPLTVTRKEIQGEDGSFRSEYELIAGERRLRASKIAGLSIVPVIIRDGEQTEQEKLELAIIENLQREDLNAVDRALAFRQLADVFGLAHSQVAKKVGRSREYVSNSIRLLALPDYMLSSLRTNDITEGHARTLLMLNDRPEEQDVVFREILLKKLSVREVEKIARGIATERVRNKQLVDNDLLEIEKEFTDALGTRVSITKTDFGGRLTIDYFSVEDLEEMLNRMRKEAMVLNKPVSDIYKDESNDTVVSDQVDEELLTLATLAHSTGIEPVINKGHDFVDTQTENFQNEAPEFDERYNDLVTESDFSPNDLKTVDNVFVSSIQEPAKIESVPAPATVVKNSLREQLAALLGGTELPEVGVTPIPERIPNNNILPTKETVKTEVTLGVNSEKVSEKVLDDDSNLYSINKFTI